MPGETVSPEQAAGLVQSGMWLDYGACHCQPDVFDRALAARKDELTNVKIRSCLSMRPRAVIEDDPEGDHFHMFSWHFTGYDRRKHDRGRCNYMPLNLGEVPDYYRRFLDPVDIAILQNLPHGRRGILQLWTDEYLAAGRGRTRKGGDRRDQSRDAVRVRQRERRSCDARWITSSRATIDRAWSYPTRTRRDRPHGGAADRSGSGGWGLSADRYRRDAQCRMQFAAGQRGEGSRHPHGDADRRARIALPFRPGDRDRARRWIRAR